MPCGQVEVKGTNNSTRAAASAEELVPIDSIEGAEGLGYQLEADDHEGYRDWGSECGSNEVKNRIGEEHIWYLLFVLGRAAAIVSGTDHKSNSDCPVRSSS